MQIDEFLELLYYHIFYSLDNYFIAVLLIIVIFELFRINMKLDNHKCTKGEPEHEKNKTDKCWSDPEDEQ